MSALGEYLFYGATQLEEDTNANVILNFFLLLYFNEFFLLNSLDLFLLYVFHIFFIVVFLIIIFLFTLLLFFKAVWEMSINTYNGLLKCLKSEEDEIVKFFAAKTIENITSQSISTGVKFANSETLTLLLQIFLITKNEGLKICTAVCLNHICRINGSLSLVLLEKLSFKQIVLVFMDGLQRIQQVYIVRKKINYL